MESDTSLNCVYSVYDAYCIQGAFKYKYVVIVSTKGQVICMSCFHSSVADGLTSIGIHRCSFKYMYGRSLIIIFRNTSNTEHIFVNCLFANLVNKVSDD